MRDQSRFEVSFLNWLLISLFHQVSFCVFGSLRKTGRVNFPTLKLHRISTDEVLLPNALLKRTTDFSAFLFAELNNERSDWIDLIISMMLFNVGYAQNKPYCLITSSSFRLMGSFTSVGHFWREKKTKRKVKMEEKYYRTFPKFWKGWMKWKFHQVGIMVQLLLALF